MVFELSSTLNVGKRPQTFCAPDAGSAFKRDSTITKLDHHNIKSSDYPQRLPFGGRQKLSHNLCSIEIPTGRGRHDSVWRTF